MCRGDASCGLQLGVSPPARCRLINADETQPAPDVSDRRAPDLSPLSPASPAAGAARAKRPAGVTEAIAVWSLFCHPATTSPAPRIIASNPVFATSAGSSFFIVPTLVSIISARSKNSVSVAPGMRHRAANLAAALGQGYPVAGGLSQSVVNDKAGARTSLALVFASLTLALCLLFLTGLLENLPKAVLAAVVLTAVAGLFDFAALARMWRVSRLDFYAAAIALVAVVLLGILQGILLAALASILMLLARVSRPHVAFLGRIPGTSNYSDLARHPDNEALPGVVAFRPEASLIYVNADAVPETVLSRLNAEGSGVRLVVCDLSASPYVDLAGARMLSVLHAELTTRGAALRIVGARGRVRDLLRAEGLGEKVGGLDRFTTLNGLLGAWATARSS